MKLPSTSLQPTTSQFYKPANSTVFAIHMQSRWILNTHNPSVYSASAGTSIIITIRLNQGFWCQNLKRWGEGRRKKQSSSSIGEYLLRNGRRILYGDLHELMQASMARTSTALIIQVNYSSLTAAGVSQSGYMILQRMRPGPRVVELSR